jgi:hypothetical protein
LKETNLLLEEEMLLLLEEELLLSLLDLELLLKLSEDDLPSLKRASISMRRFLKAF